ncbi:F-box/WD repeat-containing protein 12 isoform X3 [Lepus europaeus]|uniref:F-box/WD repeat-containing protein 12 isoform X3 n=1 Tax=Lepus europaeus TaxID=9983 RepID=UPI002B49FD97|nr:F-box/WD repeat-containing protein 12 isoform X3 [Lepus europaeus]
MNLIGYKMAVLQSPCTRERINQLWTLAVLTPSSSSCNATATWKLPGRPAGGRPAAGPCSLGQGGRGPGRHRAHRLHGQRSAVRPDGRSQDPGVGRSIRAAGVLSRACPHLQLQCLACTGCGALCVRRWHLCECDCEWLGSQSWKQIFLQRNRRERRMAHARPEDFICKQVTENVGILGPIAYLTGNDLTTDRPSRPIVCTVSSFDKLYAWDVQKGSIFWSSPVQDSSITNLVTLPELCMAVTMDRERTIKVWDCLHEDALSEFFMPYDCFSLTAFLSARGPVLMVGDSTGDMYTFKIPSLTEISRTKAFQFSVDILRCSPCRKWVFVCGTQQCSFPKVFLTECLLKPLDTPQSFSLPFLSCLGASWTPRRESRITLMFRRDPKKMGFITFDLTTRRTEDRTVIGAQQIANFLLPDHIESPSWMGVNEADMIVFSSGPYLFLFTIGGLLLRQLEDHQTAIRSLWVDPVHVLSTATDGSLHVYVWEEGGRYPYLKSCCHMKHEETGQTLGCYVSNAVCDNASIVRVVSRIRNSSILVMYTLKGS